MLSLKKLHPSAFEQLEFLNKLDGKTIENKLSQLSFIDINLVLHVSKWDSGESHLSLFACSFVLNCRNGGNCKLWEKTPS